MKFRAAAKGKFSKNPVRKISTYCPKKFLQGHPFPIVGFRMTIIDRCTQFFNQYKNGSIITAV